MNEISAIKNFTATKMRHKLRTHTFVLNKNLQFNEMQIEKLKNSAVELIYNEFEINIFH